MAQPTAYNKTRNFSQWQAANPNTVFTGADMDQEFGNIETTLDGTLDNLAMIQRDDGKLANQSVHQDAFSAAALSLIASDWTPRGLWVTATAYVVGDVVEKSDGGSYVCATAHTSGVFATDHTAGKWIVISSSNIASSIVSTPVGNLAASNVQSALQELDADLTAHMNDATAAHAASAIANTPAGNIAATTVQAALNELDTEKAIDANVVHKTGVETIAGAKTFSGVLTANEPIVLGNSTETGAPATLQRSGGNVIFHIPTGSSFIFKSENTGAGADRFKIYADGIVGCDGAGNEAAGSKKGEGIANFVGVYDNGNRVYSDTSMFEYVGAISTNSINAHAHSLGAVPKLTQYRIRCITGELGYTAGDEVEFSSKTGGAASPVYSPGWADATNIGVVMQTEILVRNKSTWADAVITNGNWNFVLRAWK